MMHGGVKRAMLHGDLGPVLIPEVWERNSEGCCLSTLACLLRERFRGSFRFTWPVLLCSVTQPIVLAAATTLVLDISTRIVPSGRRRRSFTLKHIPAGTLHRVLLSSSAPTLTFSVFCVMRTSLKLTRSNSSSSHGAVTPLMAAFDEDCSECSAKSSTCSTPGRVINVFHAWPQETRSQRSLPLPFSCS